MAERDWKVLASLENRAGDRCVDILQRPDGSWGFEEYRRDPEDSGRWTRVAYHAAAVFPTREAAEAAAAEAVPWLAGSD
jgi:hypothetical protein